MLRSKSYYEQVPIEFKEGVDTDLITPEFESLVEELICPICQCLCLYAVKCTTCEKPFCKYCITQWLKKKSTCPNRCKYQEGELSRILRNLLNKIKLKCPNNYLGCNETIIYENFEKHVKSCEYSEWKCLGEGCNFRGNKQAVIDHTTNGCSSLMEKCKYCKRSFKISEYMDHFSNCDKMAETCVYCGMYITRQNINNHTIEYCAGTVTKNYELMVNKLREEINKLKLDLRNAKSGSGNNSLSNSLEVRNNSVLSFENFVASGVYTFNNKVAGTNKVEDLNDSSMNKGKHKLNKKKI